MTSRAVAGGGRLRGELTVPGDKSVSHRALILGALATGTTEISGLSPGADVQSTRSCLGGLGVVIDGEGAVARVKGADLKLREPLMDLDAGNSGTTMRLLAGVLAGQGFAARLTGDESLTRRPMARVAEPLRLMGADVTLSEGGRAPMTVRGGELRGIEYKLPVPSAQVKSAVLLAGLRARGETTVVEPVATRDHTERMLPAFGVPVKRAGLAVSVKETHKLAAADVYVPGDPSSAAFWLVAALLAPESDVLVRGVLANPGRTGFLSALTRMGAKLDRIPKGERGGEPVEDWRARTSELHGIQLAASEIPALVDEVPILALAAAVARGSSRFRGLGELRHKESDRLAAIADLLCLFGGKAAVEGDDLVIEGGAALKPASASSRGDHRIAMTAFVAGFAAGGESTVEGAACAEISYPSFYDEFARMVS